VASKPFVSIYGQFSMHRKTRDRGAHNYLKVETTTGEKRRKTKGKRRLFMQSPRVCFIFQETMVIYATDDEWKGSKGETFAPDRCSKVFSTNACF
jgi:hypothetical protein